MPGRILCLGDPLVELVCRRAVASLTEADAFVPRLGGTAAHIAAIAAGVGARVAVAGGVGDDAWGRWLLERLEDARIDAERVGVATAATPVVFVTVDGEGRSAYVPVGEPIGGVGETQGLAVAVAESGALLLCTDSLLVGEDRAATMGAREVALDSGVPVVFDVELARHRWRSAADAAASANACVPGALLVRASARDAAVMTGEEDPERAALAVLKAGARLVVLTLGVEGVMLRGELRADLESPFTGPGAVLTGVLLGRLALSDFYPPTVAASLRDAVAASEQWGALA